MRAIYRSPLTAALIGGAVVAAAFLAFGVAGRRSTRTLLEQTALGAATTAAGELTPHAIYERDAPAVVYLTARAAGRGSWTDLFGDLEPSITTGAAFLITSSGFLMTDDHLVQAANPRTGVLVHFQDDLVRTARVVAAERSHDLAVLKVDMRGVPPVRPLELGSSDMVQAGDQALAIGNPSGEQRTLASGIVSALQRQVRAVNGFAVDDVIELAGLTGPGTQGGPLLDAGGRVIGIDSQMDQHGGAMPLAFAVPIDAIKAFVRQAEHAGAST